MALYDIAGYPEYDGEEWHGIDIHPSPKVMADFFKRKNQHNAFIQFAQYLVNLWNVC